MFTRYAVDDPCWEVFSLRVTQILLGLNIIVHPVMAIIGQMMSPC
jgi:hypothetical protein